MVDRKPSRGTSKDGPRPVVGTREWFQGGKATASTREQMIDIAPLIHEHATRVLDGDFVSFVEPRFVRSGFTNRSAARLENKQQHVNIIETIAAPIIRTARAMGMSTDDPLFTAMVVRVYLIRAGDIVKHLANQEPVTSTRKDPLTGEIKTTTIDLREEAQALAVSRRAEIEALDSFIEANFTTDEERERATYLGYAVEYPILRGRTEIVLEMQNKGFAAVLPRLQAKAREDLAEMEG